jgi:hypothetical protein
MIRALKKVKIQGSNINKMKCIYDKPMANIEWVKSESISFKIWDKGRGSTPPTLIQYSTWIFRAIRQEKEIKAIQIG